MPSKAERIAQAIVTALTVPPLASVSAEDVYRDTTRAIEKSVSAALAVEIGDEEAPDVGTIWHAGRIVEIHLSAMAKGQHPTVLADAPLVEAYNRLMGEGADRTLGGLVIDLEEGPTHRDRDAQEKPVALITKTFRVRYRTAINSLEN